MTGTDHIRGVLRALWQADFSDRHDLESARASLEALVEHGADARSGDLSRLLDESIQSVRSLLSGASPGSTSIPGLRSKLEELLQALPSDEQKAPIDPEFLGLFVDSCRERILEVEQLVLSLDGLEDPTQAVAAIRRAMHTLKGESGVLSLGEAQDLCHLAEDLIASALDADGTFPEAGVFALLDWLERYVARLVEDSSASPPDSASVRALLEPGLASKLLPDTPGTLPGRPTASGPTAKPSRADATVRIPTSRLDALVDMVGELVIAQQMVVHDPDLQRTSSDTLSRNLSQVKKITRGIQDAAMAMRMVPLTRTFQKVKRLVRDVSLQAGKRVGLTLHGEETEIDRNLVERLGDPLVHLIRNAIDHGIETEAERIRAGKDPVGMLQVRATHQGGSLLIEITDDGRGLDRGAVHSKALDSGLLPSNRGLDDVSDRELWNCLFQQGFSTAQTITELSGRGVGLDVVRKQVESMRGSIEIESSASEGTTFRLRLPLTLAIIDGMIVRAGGTRYILPTLSIEQSLRPQPGQITTILGQEEVIDVRGSLIPIYRLSQLLPTGRDHLESPDEILVLVQSNVGRACLMVDEILGQQEIVIKSIERAIPAVKHASGAAILGDGIVALILDVDSLILQSRAAVPIPSLHSSQ